MEIVKISIQNKAYIDMAKDTGEAPPSIAIEKQNTDVVNILRARCATLPADRMKLNNVDD